MFSRQDLEELEDLYERAVQALPEVQYPRGYPRYPEATKAFMRRLSFPPWNNFDYDAKENVSLLENIGSATATDLTSILTGILRSERFGDGNWAAMLESGDIDKVIKRAWELLQAP